MMYNMTKYTGVLYMNKLMVTSDDTVISFSNYGFSREDLKEYRKIIKRKFPTV